MPKTSKNKQTGEQIGEKIGTPEQLKKQSKLGCRRKYELIRQKFPIREFY
jgi:hypothetical protein